MLLFTTKTRLHWAQSYIGHVENIVEVFPFHSRSVRVLLYASSYIDTANHSFVVDSPENISPMPIYMYRGMQMQKAQSHPIAHGLHALRLNPRLAKTFVAT